MARASRRSLGHVKGKPVRYVHGHYQQRDPLADYSIEDRGYGTPCHIWRGTVSQALGYGVYAGRYAHVLAYESAHGVVPAGHVVHHRCEQKLCIRADHLEAVTRAGHPARHAQFDAQTWDAVWAATGSTREIAAQTGVSKTHVWMIRSGKQPRPIR